MARADSGNIPMMETATPTTSTMMFSGSNGVIEKLEGAANYHSWKFTLKMMLKLEGLWDLIDRNEDIAATGSDAARDQRALARLCLSVKPGLYQYVREAKTARQAWKKLSDVFEDRGLYRRVLLLRQLHRVDFTTYNKMSDYIENIMSIVHQLADIGKVIDDEEIAEILLSGLPQEYDPLVSNLETLCISSGLQSELVRTRLLQEFQRKNENSNGSSTSAFISKRQPVCKYCGKTGHIKPKCYKFKRDKNMKKKENEQPVTAFLASNSTEVYIDSGSSNHMCNNKDLLFNTRETCVQLISVANDQKLQSTLTGDMNIVINKQVKTFRNVMFVPNLSANLLSVSKLCQDGYIVQFNNEGCFLYDKDCKTFGNYLIKIACTNGIYKLEGCVCDGNSLNRRHSLLLRNRQDSLSAAVATSALSSADIWHQRLGHLNMTGMCRLRMHVCGVVFQEETHKKCEACLKGKLAAEPYPAASSSKTTEPLQLIHSDVCGPMPEASWGGARYLVTFTDDFTRKSFGYLMKNKNQVFDCFIIFKALVEKQLNLPIKCLRSDNGGEYCNLKFSQFLQREGIIHQTTVPYSPAQNGISERLNRTLFEKVRCMLQHSGLGKRFWGEAVMTALYLKNRSPTSALSGQIPEEVWSGSKIDLSHLRVFGCTAFSLVPEHKRDKLDAKGKEFIFVGYSDTSKGYRLADPLCPTKVIISRNVAFIENKFYNTNLKPSDTNEQEELNFYNFDCDMKQYCDINNQSNNNNLNSNNNNIIGLNNNENIINSGSVSISGEEYCTGSEDESSSAESSAGDVGIQLLSQPCETSDEEIAATSPVTVASHSGRPIRSTRNVPPTRYHDYDMSLLVRGNPLIDEPRSYEEAVNSSCSAEWRNAMKCEYDALVTNNVWELVDRPIDKNVVKCKWVYKVKFDASGKFDRFKARLVARGFTQREGVDYNETFSPVVRHSTMRILFSIANQYDLNIDHLDVATAFLNGDLNEVIYMEQPVGFSDKYPNKVCLLKKSIYGLKQASRMWNCKIHSLLCKHDFIQSKCEPCVYFKCTDNDLVIIALYVDDFYVFYSSNSSNKNLLVSVLENEFNVKNLGTLQSCLGINITRDRVKGILKLDQSEYIRKLLARFGMENCKAVSTPMEVNCKLLKSEKDSSLQDDIYNYRQLLGCLMYLSVCTRPDISFACSQLSQFNNCFDKSHWLAAKRILRYLAGTIHYSLCFYKSRDWFLNAFTDADWANDVVDRKSYTGFVIMLGNDTVNWESRKQRCVALSSTEAEYIAISDVCKDISFIQNLLSEIVPSYCKELKCTVYNDNQSAQRLLQVKEYCHKRTKHIDLRYHYVKDLINKNSICVKYLPTDRMIADVLTKPLSKVKHESFVNAMNVCSNM